MPLSEKLVLGIDVGTSGLKAIALGESGAVVGRAERSYPLSTPRPGWSEQDPDHWVAAAREALAELPDPEGVGFSGQMHGLVCLDAGGNVIRPAILWNDGRTTAECREIEATIGLERLIALTGNRALEGYTAPKLLWLRHHEPESYARIDSILLPKDYVRLKLLGERAIDVADASGTLLFDVANRRWSSEVIDALEIPEEWLPPVHESPDIAGAGDQARPAVGRARHVGCRLFNAAGLRRRSRGSNAYVLPRPPGGLARHGGDALGGRVADVVAGNRRRIVRAVGR